MNLDEELHQKLQAWQPQPVLPIRFQSDVWARIGARAAARQPSMVERITDWLLAVLTRPRYATGLIVAAGVFGLGLANLSAKASQARRARMLEVHYMRSVDPYLLLADSRP